MQIRIHILLYYYFQFDHLRREAVDVADAPGIEAKLEPWRAALQTVSDLLIDG